MLSYNFDRNSLLTLIEVYIYLQALKYFIKSSIKVSKEIFQAAENLRGF